MSVDMVEPRKGHRRRSPGSYTPQSESIAARARKAGINPSTLIKRIAKGLLPPIASAPPPWEVEGCSRRHWYWKQAKAAKARKSAKP